ncbi:hypothetical protein [Vibrio harveyi]
MLNYRFKHQWTKASPSAGLFITYHLGGIKERTHFISPTIPLSVLAMCALFRASSLYRGITMGLILLPVYGGKLHVVYFNGERLGVCARSESIGKFHFEIASSLQIQGSLAV